jgi:glycosyltransferase involved in cell wall biosynthesis
MKIAFIGQKGLPAKFGGVEKHVEELAIELTQRGHDVFVYARSNYTDKSIKNYKGVKVINLPSIPTKHLDAISHTFLATIHALFCNYDVVHFQAIGPSIMSWIVRVFKRDVALLATFHCQDYYHKKWGWFARKSLLLGEFLTCKIPNKTVAVSDLLGWYSRNKYGIEPVVIYNGTRVDDNKIGNIGALEKWNLESKKYVVFIGRLIRHKGVHYLIESFSRLVKKGQVPKDFKLVIIGDGFHTDDYVDEIKGMAEGRENIIFTGNLEGGNLKEIFSNAYLFVQPSESEGLSMSLLEAMGYGIPVLSSDIKENTDVIKNMGHIFKSSNVDSLTHELGKLINDSEGLEEKAFRAREEVKTKYNWAKIAKKIEDTYIEILKTKNYKNISKLKQGAKLRFKK